MEGNILGVCFNSANLVADPSQEPVLCVQGLIALVLYQFARSMEASLKDCARMSMKLYPLLRPQTQTQTQAQTDRRMFDTVRINVIRPLSFFHCPRMDPIHLVCVCVGD